MDKRFAELAAAAANNYGVFTTTTARAFGVSDRLRHEWIARGYIERLGKHTFRFVGTPSSWHASLAAGLGELGHGAAIAGRSAAALNRLDGFDAGPVEIWAPRASRNRCANRLARTNDQPLLAGDVLTIDGLRCVSAERLILDALLFQFTTSEIHNARSIPEARARLNAASWQLSAAQDCHDRASNGSTAQAPGRWPESMLSSKADWLSSSLDTALIPAGCNGNGTSSVVPN
jgi:hypothetical protein